MSKITKQQLKQHEKAEALLWGSDRQLNHDEVAFCPEHWDPRAASGKHVAQNQAYFTPMTLARDPSTRSELALNAVKWQVPACTSAATAVGW
jgi:hypothetical protein